MQKLKQQDRKQCRPRFSFLHIYNCQRTNK